MAGSQCTYNAATDIFCSLADQVPAIMCSSLTELKWFGFGCAQPIPSCMLDRCDHGSLECVGGSDVFAMSQLGLDSCFHSTTGIVNLTLSRNVSVYGTLVIDPGRSLCIAGYGNHIHGSGKQRLFRVGLGATLELTNVTLANGHAGDTTNGGGALILVGSTFVGHRVSFIDNYAASAGAAVAILAQSSFRCSDCFFQLNSKGVITSNDSKVVLIHSSFEANAAPSVVLSGGSILQTYGMANLDVSYGDSRSHWSVLESVSPSHAPTALPTPLPSAIPTQLPTNIPTPVTPAPSLTRPPSSGPTVSHIPTHPPSYNPTASPTTQNPTSLPSLFPTTIPTPQPSATFSGGGKAHHNTSLQSLMAWSTWILSSSSCAVCFWAFFAVLSRAPHFNVPQSRPCATPLADTAEAGGVGVVPLPAGTLGLNLHSNLRPPTILWLEPGSPLSSPPAVEPPCPDDGVGKVKGGVAEAPAPALPAIAGSAAVEAPAAAPPAAAVLAMLKPGDVIEKIQMSDGTMIDVTAMTGAEVTQILMSSQHSISRILHLQPAPATAIPPAGVGGSAAAASPVAELERGSKLPGEAEAPAPKNVDTSDLELGAKWYSDAAAVSATATTTSNPIRPEGDFSE